MDELSLRRPGMNVATSVMVTLGDARQWLLPKPWLEVWPTAPVTGADKLIYDDALESLIEAVKEAEGDDLYSAGAGLAAYMLGFNYSLDDSQLSTILEFREEVPWLNEVMSTAVGVGGSKSFSRWRRLSLMAQGTLPDLILLEDANDLVGFIEFSKRTIPRSRWAEESIAAGQADQVEGLF
jgi:hypothetical protein